MAGQVTPETRYARLGDLHLAYQVLGEGPPDILLLDQWFSHMEAQWDVPQLARFRERLASFGRLIMFDKRGTGLSDPVPTSALPTVEEWMDDVPAVLDAVGSRAGRPHHEHRRRHHGHALRGRPPGPRLEPGARRLLRPVPRRAGLPDRGAARGVGQALGGADASGGRGVMIDLFAPSLAGDVRLRRAWSRYERQAASPGGTMAIVRLIYESDVRAILPAHPGADPRHPSGRRARLQRSSTGGTWPATSPAPSTSSCRASTTSSGPAIRMRSSREIQAFVTGVRPVPGPHRVLATVLFTDIVGSTRLAAELGDERWHALLDEHHRTARRVDRLRRPRGEDGRRWHPCDVRRPGTGDPLRRRDPRRGARARTSTYGPGLHTGEIEVQPDDIVGLAVHIGARIAALAEGGEVLVSSTVKDLVVRLRDRLRGSRQPRPQGRTRGMAAVRRRNYLGRFPRGTAARLSESDRVAVAHSLAE